MNLKEVIDAALLMYLNQEDRMPIKKKKRISRPTYVRPSRLAGCPLAAARDKARVPMDIPEKDPSKDVSTVYTMSAGSYMEAMMCEALQYYASKVDDVESESDVPCVDDEWKLSGRIDGLLSVGDEIAILEFKYAMTGSDHKPAEMKESYALQALAYKLMLERKGVDAGAFVITLGKYDYKLFEYRQGCFYDTTTGDIAAGYGGWNHENNLNAASIVRRSEEIQVWMDAIADNPFIRPFVEDPLNHQLGWLCVEKTKPTKNTPGSVKPRCGWCTTCHGIDSEMPIVFDGSTYSIDNSYFANLLGE